MAELWTCKLGHRWEGAAAEGATVDDAAGTCPVCGSQDTKLLPIANSKRSHARTSEGTLAPEEEEAPASSEATYAPDEDVHSVAAAVSDGTMALEGDEPASPPSLGGATVLGTIALEEPEHNHRPATAAPAASDQTMAVEEADEPASAPVLARPRVAAPPYDDRTQGLDDELPADVDASDGTMALEGPAAPASEDTCAIEDGPSGARTNALDRTVGGETAGPNPAPDGTLVFNGNPFTANRADVDGTIDLEKVGQAGTLDGDSKQPADLGTLAFGPEAAPPAGDDRTVDVDESMGATQQPKPKPSLRPLVQPKKKASPGAPVVPGYEILKELGRGGMGVVYKAKQDGLNRMVALKMILAAGHAGAQAVARFRAEAEAIGQFQHPNIVQVYEISECEGKPFFSLEYVDGGCLADKVAGIPQPPREAAEMVRILAEAMESAHRRGIIHRDLKPANIMLTATGVPKITDFGLAKKFEEDSGVTREGAIMGTPSYMAPEQAEGKTKQLGPPADIYALGAILYDLVTGRPPFRGETLLQTLQQVRSQEPVAPRRLRPQMPKDLEIITLKCLEKDPKKRYQSSGSLADDLRRFLDEEPIHARPVGRVERLTKWAKRNPTMAALIGVIATSLLLLTIGGIVFGVRQAALRRAADDAKQQAIDSEQEAVAAKNDADVRRAEAVQARDDEKIQREKAVAQEKQAKTNFQYAWDAVDEMLTRVGQEHLENQPRMEKVRRDLLVRALNFLERFLQTQQNDPLTRWETGKANLRAADIQHMLGDDDKSQAAYEKAVGLLADLVKQTPEDAAYAQKYQFDLATAYCNFGILMYERNRPQDADEYFRKASELLKHLTSVDEGQPESKDHQHQLAISLANHAALLASQSKIGDAEKLYLEAIPKEQELTRRFANVPDYPSELAHMQRDLGSLYYLSQQFNRVEQPYRDAVATYSQLHVNYPDVPDYRSQLAITYANLGNFLKLDPNRRKDAVDAFDQAQGHYDGLAREFPAVLLYPRQQAIALGSKGETLAMRQDYTPAKQAFEDSIKLQNNLVANYKQVPGLRQELARTLGNLGFVMVKMQEPKKAEENYRQALEVLKPLDESATVLQDRVVAWSNLATLLVATDQKLKAEEAWRQAVAAQRKLVADAPKDPLSHARLAAGLNDLAKIQEDLDKLSDEADTLKEAAAEQKVSFDLTGEARQRGWVCGMLHRRADVLIRLKDHTAAAQTVADMGMLLPDNWDRPAEAALLGRCMTLVSEDPKLGEPARQAKARTYGDLAMKLLQEAVAKGFKNASALKQPDFRPLAEREDFKKLLADLEKA